MKSTEHRYRAALAAAAVAAASVVGVVTSGQPPAGATDPPNEAVERISGNWAAQGDSTSLSLSDDGKVVAFESVARDLVEEPQATVHGVYAYDRRTQTIELLGSAGDSLLPGGVSLDGDGSTAVMWGWMRTRRFVCSTGAPEWSRRPTPTGTGRRRGARPTSARMRGG